MIISSTMKMIFIIPAASEDFIVPAHPGFPGAIMIPILPMMYIMSLVPDTGIFGVKCIIPGE